MSELDPKPDWEPTRLQLAKSHVKDYFGAAVLLGIIAVCVLLYLAAMTFVFHRWR